RYASHVLKDGLLTLGNAAHMDAGAALRALPRLVRNQAWRSLLSMVSSHVKNDKLREALTAELLLVGGNPATTTTITALRHALEQQGGIWWPRGGFGKLTQAMASLFTQMGGQVRLHDPVLHIHTLGDRVNEVETVSGWRERFDAVASNADIVHTYRDLLAGTQRGSHMARSLVRKRWSSSMFVVHFGVEGAWPGIPHRMVLFGNRYKALLTDIFEHGVLPRDAILFLDHPSVTDESMAPAGKSTFRAMIPVANQGRLPIDWEQTGPMIERRILDEVGRRLIPDLDDRIVTKFHYSPRDYALDMNAHNGSPFGLEPLLGQSGLLRPHNRDGKLKNLYLVGAGTHPGAGIPAVLHSAQATARVMQEDIR
ncbi:MAG: phytoene desaturase family protein, partial [Novosphingobium sp.]